MTAETKFLLLGGWVLSILIVYSNSTFTAVIMLLLTVAGAYLAWSRFDSR